METNNQPRPRVVSYFGNVNKTKESSNFLNELIQQGRLYEFSFDGDNNMYKIFIIG